MLYSYTLDVPPSTPATSPETLDMDLPGGVIERVEVQFPAGCAGLVHVWIDRALHQLYPANDDADLASDGETISWRDDYELYDEPRTLVANAYSDDDTYTHTITIRVNMLQTQRAVPASSPGVIGRLRNALMGVSE